MERIINQGNFVSAHKPTGISADCQGKFLLSHTFSCLSGRIAHSRILLLPPLYVKAGRTLQQAYLSPIRLIQGKTGKICERTQPVLKYLQTRPIVVRCDHIFSACVCYRQRILMVEYFDDSQCPTLLRKRHPQRCSRPLRRVVPNSFTGG